MTHTAISKKPIVMKIVHAMTLFKCLTVINHLAFTSLVTVLNTIRLS